jgi:hypothetical protein
MIKWFLSLLLLMCSITFIDLRMLNHPCIPGTKPSWLWWMIFLMCYWIQSAIILLSIFALIWTNFWCMNLWLNSYEKGLWKGARLFFY